MLIFTAHRETGSMLVNERAVLPKAKVALYVAELGGLAS
jgi:hypothetical protein